MAEPALSLPVERTDSLPAWHYYRDNGLWPVRRVSRFKGCPQQMLEIARRPPDEEPRLRSALRDTAQGLQPQAGGHGRPRRAEGARDYPFHLGASALDELGISPDARYRSGVFLHRAVFDPDSGTLTRKLSLEHATDVRIVQPSVILPRSL